MNLLNKTYLVLFLIISSLPQINPQQQVDIPWPTLANSDWPMIKHDPQFTGRSPYKGPQSSTVVWTVDMPNGIFSGPVIGEDENLYFGSYYVFGDKFYSYSPDGNFIWEYSTGNGRATQSGIVIDSSNTIYFGSRDSNFYALNPDGTFKWKYHTSAQIYQEVIPNIDLQGNLYITNSTGELYSIKPDGKLNWSVTYENGFGSGSPVFSPDGNTIYIAGFDSNLFALDLNGIIKWKFSCGIIQKAPMIDSEGNIYLAPSGYFYSLNPDGNIRWSYFTALNNFSIPTIDKQGNIYTLDFTCCPVYLRLISFNYNGNFRWDYLFDDVDPNMGTDDFWQPLICDSEGTVYVGSTQGFYYYAISSDGELKWKLPLIEQEQQVDNTGAISKDGTLYLGVHNISLISGQTKTLLAIRDTVTSVENDDEEITSFTLEQNYPNPFNSTTHIKYTIPYSGNVTIKVFDLLGREVASLLNRYQNKGEYDIIFQPEDFSSGIYFYQLQAGDFVSIKKLILLK